MAETRFRRELFLNAEEYEEVPLRDRKSNLPFVRRPAEKAELLRDIIALANTARLLGRPGYLIFGMAPSGENPLLGVEAFLDEYALHNRERAWESAQHEIGQAVKEYIAPPLPGVELLHGVVNGRELGYLLIPPTAVPEPFHVARDFSKDATKAALHEGSSWIRFGESKERVDSRQEFMMAAPWVYAYSQVPYPFPSALVHYFAGVQAEWDTQMASGIEPYLDLQVSGSEHWLDDELTLLHRAEGGFLAVVGEAGSGKSVAVRRFLWRLAEAGLVAASGQMEREEFGPPLSQIPIYFPLRDAHIVSGDALAKEVIRCANQIGRFWVEEPSSPELLLEAKGFRWVVCFDGLDEIWDIEGRRHFMAALRQFRRRFSGVRVLLTSRDGVTIPDDVGRRVTVAPLTQSQVRAYLSYYGEKDAAVRELLDLAESDAELMSLCSVPLFLGAIANLVSTLPVPMLEPLQDFPEYSMSPVQTGNVTTAPESANMMMPSLPRVDVGDLMLMEPTEPRECTQSDDVPSTGAEGSTLVTLGWLLDQAYERIVSREAARRIYDVDDLAVWRDGVGRLALYIDGSRGDIRRQTVTPRFMPDAGLRWWLGLGILRRRRSTELLGFSARVTQIYFAATVLRPYVEGRAHDVAEIQPLVTECSRAFRDKVANMLSQIIFLQIADQHLEEVIYGRTTEQPVGSTQS